MRARQKTRFAPITAACLIMIAAITSHCLMNEQDVGTPFVGRRGTSFTLHGERFRFVGANMGNTAGDPAIHQCGPRMEDPDQELDGWFRRAREEFGAGVVRFWAFQSYTRGGTDWRAMDRVMRLAGAPSNPPNTLGHAIEAARRLNKPLLIGEAGMRLCTAPPGERAETPASRAAKFEAKLSAFFQAGGGGYLIWDWKPANDCAHAFTSGDPLNEVLRVQVERLTRRGADP